MVPSPRFTTSASEAAAALLAGNLVALPTETVYGLGGLAHLPAAIERIFQVKNRPTDHPLIVHIAGVEAITDWAQEVPRSALDLADAFWPGPLTLVVPRAPSVSDAITGGQPTVALRAPAHPLFQDVLAELTDPAQPAPGIAAPSANRFGQVSPTTAEHVEAGLGPYLSPSDLILDGGACTIGVESTIVLCGDDHVRIARSGGITAEQLAGVVPVLTAQPQSAAPRVPGSLDAHYAPSAQVAMVTTATELSAFRERNLLNSDIGVIALARDVDFAAPNWLRLATPQTSDEYAHELYSALRTADKLGLTHVVALAPPDEGIGTAIRDRLRRASQSD